MILGLQPHLPMQASGSCDWNDVRQYFDPPSHKFYPFARRVRFESLIPEQLEIAAIADDSLLKLALKSFEGPALELRTNNERVLQPAVHNTLLTAADLASERCQRLFVAISEPSVYDEWPDRLGDETVYESVSDDMDMRILVEVKGSVTLPKHSATVAPMEPMFCQLMQQTAMALVARKWRGKILTGLTTLDAWYLFKVVDVSKSGFADVKLEIRQSTCHTLIPPFTPGQAHIPEQSVRTFKALLAFLISHLCSAND